LEREFEIFAHVGDVFVKELDHQLGITLGITYAQARVIEKLRDRTEMQHGDLAKKIERDAGATSRLITRLIEKRLVKSWSDKADRRRKWIALTKEGVEIGKQIPLEIKKIDSALLKDIFPEEQNKFMEILHRIMARCVN
jgi:MarR family transcriptional regulator, temperature-dependent positive regulator of motility